MNTLAWLVAMVASITMAYQFFSEYTGATFELIGWTCIGLTLFCLVATVDALLDDLKTGGGFGQ